MLKTILWPMLAAISLSACATSLPPAQAPFTGGGGLLTIEGTATTNEATVYESGDIFAEVEVKHSRTGVLQNTVTAAGFFGGKFTLDAGTDMYAMTFRSAGYGSSNAAINSSVAWCAGSKSKLLGIKTGEAPLCIFWHDGETSTYIQGAASDSIYYAPRLNVNSVVMGDMPEIVEQDVDFGTTLKLQAIFQKVRKKSIDVKIQFTDGKETTSVRTISPQKKDDDTATLPLWGGSFKLSPVDMDDNKTARIDVVNAPTGKPIDAEAFRDALSNLIQALEAAKAAEELKAAEDAVGSET